MARLLLSLAILAAPALGAAEWRRPFIGDVFFYWYLYDRDTELGWRSGVHFTPLDGYYDSRTFADNRRSLWTASEWGMTHHFIDYWAPTWKDEHGQMREKTVFRAAESLRKDGYDIAMAYYQDGSNFAMDAFAKNVSERRDVHQWLRDFGPSPVMPRVGSARKPLQLVYGRNGVPKLTATDEGFRQWLRTRYGTIEALNRAWGGHGEDAGHGDPAYKPRHAGHGGPAHKGQRRPAHIGPAHNSFREVRLDFGFGRHRADSIRYQYHVWRQEWAKLDGLVRDEFKLPGVAASFDIGYKPFRGWGRSEYFRTFGGPHSYGGIFGQPHDQDAHRFLCSILAKKHDTVFFDHYKHCYHDWNIRVPGTAYLHDPHHFDRFWVGCLQRFNEGILHMSWNEWWEGSNLEPSMETGKLYCEKHLFYATLMKRCFPAIRDWGKGARIALILNDWHLLTAQGTDDDLFAAVQALRRLGARFDILPEERVTAAALKPFKLVIAPGCTSGFGDNDRLEPVHDILLAWCRQGGRLWASANPRLAAAAGLKASAGKQSAERGKDLNLFLDVGVAGDEKFLLGGASGRENWGKLPKGAFGAGTHLTVRWTPATGTITRLLLPLSPNRDHVLRFGGSALLANRVEVLLDNRPAGTIDLKAGVHDYGLRIPAALVGGRQMATIALRYAQPVIPKERFPKRFPTEGRACNLALDWLQWSTANVAKGDRRTTYVAPRMAVRFSAPLFELDGERLGTVEDLDTLRQPPLAAPAARPLSTYADGAGRDMLLPLGKGELLYVNGQFSDLPDLPGLLYWHALLANWAKLPPPRPIVASDDVMAARLDTDDTTILLAYNEDIAVKSQPLRLRMPARDVPLSEALILSKDGETYLPLKTRVEGGHIVADDHARYYGIYQLAFAPVRVTLPKLQVCQGTTATVQATVENLTDRPVKGAIRIACIVPTLGGPPADVSLAPRETKQVALTIESSKLCDWGTKTVTLELAFAGRRAHLLRPCLVLRRPDIQLATPVIDAQSGQVRLVNKPTRFAVNAAATDVRVSLGPAEATLARLANGEEAKGVLRVKAKPGAQPELRPVTLDVSYRIGDGPRESRRLSAHLAVCPDAFDAPADAVQPVVVFNSRATWLDHVVVNVPTAAPQSTIVRTANGRVAAWSPQHDKAGRGMIRLAALVPPRSARVFFLCRAAYKPTPPPSPLRVEATELGTGKGKVVVSNERFAVTFDEARGGTMTSLVSKRTGREYAAESFGAAYGRFGRYDPAEPRTTTVAFAQPALTRQADGRASVALRYADPWRAVVESRWSDGRCDAQQRYAFSPWCNGFTVAASGTLRAAAAGQELVVLDARFRAEHFAKSYPNFVGMVDDKEQPHFGWRRGAWVPEVVTFMHPPDFAESLSLLRLDTLGMWGVRQGFWPKARPQPGRVAYAWAEYIADRQAGERSGVTVGVLLHSGHHRHARRSGRFVPKDLPVALSPKQFTWGKRFKPIDVAFPKDWFSPYWHARLVVAVPNEKGRITVSTAALAKELGGRPKALRCVQANKGNDLAERDFEMSDDGSRVVVDVAPRWGRTLHVYGSLEPLPSPLMLRRTQPGIPLEHFETPAKGWALEQAQLGAFGREGTKGVRLRVGEGGQPVVLSNRAVSVLPQGVYRLSFWARTTTPGAIVRANFYAGAKHDFPQVPVALTADGQWHRYEAAIRAGKFPASVRPCLRLWALGRPQTIDIDDVGLKPHTPPPAPIAATKVERLR